MAQRESLVHHNNFVAQPNLLPYGGRGNVLVEAVNTASFDPVAGLVCNSLTLHADILSQPEGILYFEGAITQVSTGNQTPVNLSTGDASEAHRLELNSSEVARGFSPGMTGFNTIGAPWVITVNHRFALYWIEDLWNISLDGVNGTQDTSGTPASFDRLHVGNLYTHGTRWRGTIKEVRVYNEHSGGTGFPEIFLAQLTNGDIDEFPLVPVGGGAGGSGSSSGPGTNAGGTGGTGAAGASGSSSTSSATSSTSGPGASAAAIIKAKPKVETTKHNVMGRPVQQSGVVSTTHGNNWTRRPKSGRWN